MRGVRAKMLKKIAIQQYALWPRKEKARVPFKNFCKWVKRLYTIGELKFGGAH